MSDERRWKRYAEKKREDAYLVALARKETERRERALALAAELSAIHKARRDAEGWPR